MKYRNFPIYAQPWLLEASKVKLLDTEEFIACSRVLSVLVSFSFPMVTANLLLRGRHRKILFLKLTVKSDEAVGEKCYFLKDKVQSLFLSPCICTR